MPRLPEAQRHRMDLDAGQLPVRKFADRHDPAISTTTASWAGVTSYTVLWRSGLRPGRPDRSGRCAAASCPLAKVAVQDSSATVPLDACGTRRGAHPRDYTKGHSD
jgi:hypothetical protein